MALAAAVAVAAALALRGPAWSTDSPQALAEFQQGVEASMKLYFAEARRCFARAVAADPTFLAAKAFLLDHLDPRAGGEGRAALLAELEAADLSGLTPREQFLVRRSLAAARGNHSEVEALVRDFTARYPDDPFGLLLFGQAAVKGGDLGQAREVFQRLTRLAPNWVMAYNHLGYLAMAEGKLAEAERMFLTYRYIAPDQANPHDSLGELYLLTGRLEEAEREFELALEAHLDFPFAYENLVRVATLRGDEDGVEAALYRARESGVVTPDSLLRLECWARGWLAARRGDWEAVAAGAAGDCKAHTPAPLALRAAYFAGRPELAAAVRERLASPLRRGADSAAARTDREINEAYLQGIEAAAAGEVERAAHLFQAAAADASFMGFQRGWTKLALWSSAAKAWQRLGLLSHAAAAEEAIRQVNPAAGQMLGAATDLPFPPTTP